MSSELITNLLLGLLGLAWIGDFVRGLFQRKKVSADAGLSDAQATQVIVGSATVIVQQLKSRIDELQAEVTVLRTSLHEATNEANHMRDEAHRSRLQLQSATDENRRVTAENQRLRLQIGEATT